MKQINSSIFVIMAGLITGIIISGCATVSYEDAQGHKFEYSRFGNQAIKGLKVDQTTNTINLEIQSVQSDTQALTDAVKTLAGGIRP